MNAAEGARFSDDISHPDGDTSDLISVTLDPLPQRGETFMQFTLECTGVGVEVLRWQVRGITSELSCGALARVPFSASASQQTVVVTFERSAQQSYVAYTLSITPPQRMGAQICTQFFTLNLLCIFPVDGGAVIGLGSLAAFSR